MSGPRRDPDLVRPYVRTDGRTRAHPDVRLETVVLAASGPREGLSADARRVMSLFGNARGGGLAVADIAAALEFPPSTVRIIVSSLIDEGLLTRPVPAGEDQPETDLLQEVLRGLRALV
ncbi:MULTISPECIES: DUF742 domain-containing protein [Streptomyces]|uniref:DUF742 domain-containing protein n=1 Tax=Streptomyces TaxID=1883 RepID=UPI000AB432C9|nr:MULTISPECIES: DUF742 domain-containing protein [Streptomyces]